MRIKRKRDKDGIYARGEGWLWLQHAGRRVSLKTKDRPTAHRRALDYKLRCYDPAHAMTLLQACTAFRSHASTAENRRKPPSPDTFEMYECHFAHFGRVFGNDTRLDKIDATAVDRYIATRRGTRIGKPPPKGEPDARRTVQAATVDKELRTLRQILRLGLRRGWCYLPLDRILPRSVGGASVPLERALTCDELPMLLAVLPEGRAATCAFLVAFGADWCAVERAELADFGGADWCALRVLIRGSKNARRFAEVPIVPPFGELAERARVYLVEHGRFPGWGKQRVRDLATACRRAGVPRITPRDLRRTHGQILADRGVPPYLIAEMLRHADSRMAERVYARRSREAVGRQVAAITRTTDFRTRADIRATIDTTARGSLSSRPRD